MMTGFGYDTDDLMGNCSLCDTLIHCDQDWVKDDEFSDVFYHVECREEAAKEALIDPDDRPICQLCNQRVDADEQAKRSENHAECEEAQRMDHIEAMQEEARYNFDHGGD
jgi:hypothetical protein